MGVGSITQAVLQVSLRPRADIQLIVITLPHKSRRNSPKVDTFFSLNQSHVYAKKC